MKATRLLHDFDRCKWLDNIPACQFASGTLSCMDELSVLCLISNPAIVDYVNRSDLASGVPEELRIIDSGKPMSVGLKNDAGMSGETLR